MALLVVLARLAAASDLAHARVEPAGPSLRDVLARRVWQEQETHAAALVVEVLAFLAVGRDGGVGDLVGFGAGRGCGDGEGGHGGEEEDGELHDDGVGVVVDVVCLVWVLEVELMCWCVGE